VIFVGGTNTDGFCAIEIEADQLHACKRCFIWKDDDHADYHLLLQELTARAVERMMQSHMHLEQQRARAK
jgi:hypothetical protein